MKIGDSGFWRQRRISDGGGSGELGDGGPVASGDGGEGRRWRWWRSAAEQRLRRRSSSSPAAASRCGGGGRREERGRGGASRGKRGAGRRPRLIKARGGRGLEEGAGGRRRRYGGSGRRARAGLRLGSVAMARWAGPWPGRSWAGPVRRRETFFYTFFRRTKIIKQNN